MLEIFATAAIAAGIVAGLTVLFCAMLSSRISRAEERAEAKRQVNLKNKNLVYNREREGDHEQDE